MSFAREAWVFVLPVAAAAAAAWFLQWPRTAVAVAVLALLVLTFFRIPARATSAAADLLLAPANGKVTEIRMVEEPLLGPEPVTRITTFLSVFNVHVQRAPVSGKVVASEFRPGRKIAAFRPEAGEVNESHLVVLESAHGRIGVKQIAGLVARRVVSYLETGQEVERGELIGVIKFGSRVDIYIPAAHEVLVAEGEVLTEGLTPIARGAGAGTANGTGTSVDGDHAAQPQPKAES